MKKFMCYCIATLMCALAVIVLSVMVCSFGLMGFYVTRLQRDTGECRIENVKSVKCSGDEYVVVMK